MAFVSQQIISLPEGGLAMSKSQLFWGAAVLVALFILVGTCASGIDQAIEDAGDFSCRTSVQCDDEGNCTSVTECD